MSLLAENARRAVSEHKGDESLEQQQGCTNTKMWFVRFAALKFRPYTSYPIIAADFDELSSLDRLLATARFKTWKDEVLQQLVKTCSQSFNSMVTSECKPPFFVHRLLHMH